MKANTIANRALSALAAAALSLTIAGCAESPQASSAAIPVAEPIPVVEIEPAEIIRVVDGDTLTVRIDDGAEEKVRLIGIDAPESKSPEASENCPEGEQAEEHLRETLPKGTRVWMSKDKSERDRYGRLLRYVWLNEPSGQEALPQEFCEKCLNARLVIEGWAQAKRYPPDISAADLLDALGESAAAQGLGISAKWAGDSPTASKD